MKLRGNERKIALPFMHSHFCTSDSQCAFFYVNIQNIMHFFVETNARNYVNYSYDVNGHVCKFFFPHTRNSIRLFTFNIDSLLPYE